MISEWKRRGVVTKICLKEKAKNTALPVEKNSIISAALTLRTVCKGRERRLGDSDAWRLINIVMLVI
jgi:hypothetical protein